MTSTSQCVGRRRLCRPKFTRGSPLERSGAESGSKAIKITGKEKPKRAENSGVEETECQEDSVEFYLDDDEFSHWWTCECIISLLLVAVLAFLPFNLHSYGMFYRFFLIP